MYNFRPELALNENLLNAMLPLWKNHQIKEAELRKSSPACIFLLDWVRWSVEYKLKKESLNAAINSLPEVSQTDSS